MELVQAMSNHASKELIEVFDRVIGSNIYEVPSYEIIPTLNAFMSSGKARDKIFLILYKRVKKHMNEFLLTELC